MQTAKACGECTLCCTVLKIPVLEKPKDRLCVHCASGSGCTIYESRPQVCRGFQCRWTLDPAMGPEWQPSRSGLVLVMDSDTRLAVHVDPDRPDAWRREPYLSTLRRLAAMRLPRGEFIFVMEKGRTTVLLPQQEIALGEVGPDDRILLRELPTRGLFAAEVVSQALAEALAGQPGWDVTP
jgi:hypothetical protein